MGGVRFRALSIFSDGERVIKERSPSRSVLPNISPFLLTRRPESPALFSGNGMRVAKTEEPACSPRLVVPRENLRFFPCGRFYYSTSLRFVKGFLKNFFKKFELFSFRARKADVKAQCRLGKGGVFMRFVLFMAEAVEL